jgi:hypothetical protein
MSPGRAGTGAERRGVDRCQRHGVVACVDDPLDARGRMRNLTGGSTAIMCPACCRGAMTAGPDGVRDPVPNMDAASKAGATSGFSGSSVRPIVISFGSFIPASTRGFGGLCLPARYRGPCHVGHPDAQSRPKPRGGSIACSSPRSRSQIACSASARALSRWFAGRASSQAT